MGAAAYLLAQPRENPHGLILGSCEDRLAAPVDERWRRHPTTKYLEARIPFTWGGRRDYHDVLGRKVIRVLHRPSQITAQSFLRGLRRIPVAAGHPMLGGQSVDIDTSNARRFEIGRVGDLIELVTVPLLDGDKVIGECQVPAGIASISDERAISKITDPRDPHTQTSLGYLPLWAPPLEGEVTGEVDGFPVGTFVTDEGARIEYDKEHILDEQDPRVLALAKADPKFVPANMGPNHLAAVLRNGRGDSASEMLRLVDCRDAAGTRTHFFYTHTQPQLRPGDHTMSDSTQAQAILTSLVPVRVCDFSTDHRAMLARHGVNFPAFRTLDMPNPEAAQALQMISMELDKVIQALAGAEQATEAAEGERDAEKGLREAAEGEKEEAVQMATDAKTKLEALEAEVAPLRQEQLDAIKFEAAALLGCTDNNDAEQVAKLPDAVRTGSTPMEVKRATVIALNALDVSPVPNLDKRSDDYIDGAYTARRTAMKTPAADAGGETSKARRAIDVETASPFGRKVATGAAPARDSKTPSALRQGIAVLNN